MSIEHCSNFRRTAKPDTQNRFEVSWCAVKGTDYGCGGYSDGCPTKMQKYFVSDRGVKEVTFERESMRNKQRGLSPDSLS